MPKFDLKDTDWDTVDVVKLIANPIYAGLGPLPPMLTREEWIASALEVMQDIGAERFLVLLLEGLAEAFTDVSGFEGTFVPPYGYYFEEESPEIPAMAAGNFPEDN